MVILGKDELDLRWITDHLLSVGVTADDFTIYDGTQEMEINLENYLKERRGPLVTLGELFDGMECPTVVYAFTDPYPGLRRNILRAIREIILLDRNTDKLTDHAMILETVKGKSNIPKLLINIKKYLLIC